MMYLKTHYVLLVVFILDATYAAPLDDNLSDGACSGASVAKRGNETIVTPDCVDCDPLPPIKAGRCCLASCGVCDPDNIECFVCTQNLSTTAGEISTDEIILDSVTLTVPILLRIPE